MEGKPTMYVLAGPEGSGKSTFYQINMQHHSKLSPEIRPPYVSADQVQSQTLGEMSTRAFGAGNLIANQQSRDLISQKRSFVTETSFSNPRDVALVDEAKRSGFRVVLIQVQTQSPNLSVARVAERVREGGRDAPEHAVRDDYSKSAALIAQASKSADYTMVYDTSALNQSPRHLMTLERGRISHAAATAEIPAWARQVYGQQLQAHREGNMSAAEKSFASAVDKAELRTPNARVQIAGHKPGEYAGPIVEKTQHHVLQKTGEKDYVVHFKARLAVVPTLDQDVKLAYSASRDKGQVEFLAPPAPQNEAARKAEGRDFLTKPREEAIKNPRLAAAYAAKDALMEKANDAGPRTDNVEREVDKLVHSSIAARLSEGKGVTISRAQVDMVQYQVASRSLDAAVQEKQMEPERNPRIDPEHRRIIVERTDRVANGVESTATTLHPESPAFKEATRIAEKLAQHDGSRVASPFKSRALSEVYKQTQSRELNQQQQRQQARGMER